MQERHTGEVDAMMFAVLRCLVNDIEKKVICKYVTNRQTGPTCLAKLRQLLQDLESVHASVENPGDCDPWFYQCKDGSCVDRVEECKNVGGTIERA